MTGTHMPSTAHVEPRSGAMIHTTIVVVSVPSKSGARYFITSIDEWSDHMMAFHKELKGKAAELVRRQVSWARLKVIMHDN